MYNETSQPANLHADIDQLGRAELLPRSRSRQPTLSSPTSASDVIGEPDLPVVRRRKVGGVLPALLVDAPGRVEVHHPVAHLKKLISSRQVLPLINLFMILFIVIATQA